MGNSPISLADRSDSRISDSNPREASLPDLEQVLARGNRRSHVVEPRLEVFERVEAWGTEYWVVMQDPEGNEFCVQ